jgi:hypothetical protein
VRCLMCCLHAFQRRVKVNCCDTVEWTHYTVQPVGWGVRQRPDGLGGPMDSQRCYGMRPTPPVGTLAVRAGLGTADTRERTWSRQLAPYLGCVTE